MASKFIKEVNGFPVVDIGKMRHQISIQQADTTSSYDDSGVAQSTWFTVATCMAAVDTSGVKRPDDVIHTPVWGAQLFVEFVFYYQALPGLVPSMRILSDNGNYYVIQTVENVGEYNMFWIARCIALGDNT
jgi:hypothetical protein